MPTLTITIKGIALVTEDGDTWNIYMPFEGCHAANVKREDEPGPGINLNYPGQKLDVSVRGPVPRLSQGPNFDEFFDINHPDAHADGVSLRDDWENGAVRVSIPGGSYSAAVSRSPFVLRRTDNSGATPAKNLGTIGTMGTVVIEGDEITVNAAGEENFTWQFSEDAAITIDNDCNGQDRDERSDKAAGVDGIDNNRDFHLLYNVIRDAADPNRRFDVRSGDPSLELPCNNNRATKLV